MEINCRKRKEQDLNLWSCYYKILAWNLNQTQSSLQKFYDFMIHIVHFPYNILIWLKKKGTKRTLKSIQRKFI